MTLLWAALGRPPPEGLLPAARSPCWVAARQLLRRAADPPGSLDQMRSPWVLWRTLHGGSAPRSATWQDLLGQSTVCELQEKLQATVSASLTVTSWNPRWLVSTVTDKAVAKREAIQKLVVAGNIVCLQETHWSKEDAATWTASFPGARLYANPARKGRKGGPQGGSPS